MKNRIMASLLIVCMLLVMLPVTAAADDPTYVAEVNGTQYTDLQAAIDAANAGQTLKLLSDINTVTVDKAITIDGNGMTITGSINLKSDVTIVGTLNVSGVYYINSGNIIIDSGADVDCSGTFGIWDGGSVTVNSGAELSASSIYFNGGAIDVYGTLKATPGNDGGLILNGDGDVINVYDDGVLDVSYVDIYKISGNSTVNVYGEAKVGFKLSDGSGKFNLNILDGGSLEAVKNGIVINSAGSVITVDTESKITATKINDVSSVQIDASDYTGGSLDNVINIDGVTSLKGVKLTGTSDYKLEVSDDGKVSLVAYVAAVGSNKYTSLQEAIVAAAPSGTVEILSDVTVDKWIMISETLSISNGKIITLDMNGLTINGNGHTLTVNSIESAGNGNRLFYDATKLNINDLTIKYADGLDGAIGLKAGTINNVTFDGCTYGVMPQTGNVKIENCTFKTNGSSIYFEEERDGLTVTGCTFENADEANVILIRGDVIFTDNTIVSGRTVNVVSGSPVVTGNDFNDVRLKVYNEATATITNNEINNLAFNDDSNVGSTFTANTMSDEALIVLEDVLADSYDFTVKYTDGVENEVVFADQITLVKEGADTPAFVGTPTRSGYVFIGWTPGVAPTVTRDVVYTANWISDENSDIADGLAGIILTDDTTATMMPEKDVLSFGDALDLYQMQIMAQTGSFADVSKSDWFYSDVTALVSKGVVSGYPDGSFRPQGVVTWGEALKLVMKAVGYGDIDPTNGHWASGYMDTALANLLISGEVDLDAAITREEVANLAAQALKLAPVGIEYPFDDAAPEAAVALYAAGIINGSADNGQLLFRAESTITRAEMAAIIWRVYCAR